MKPTLLFLCGWSYAATSPLAYTLQRLVKYAHGGYDKNLQYLRSLKNPLTHDTHLRKTYTRILFNRWENHNINEGHKLNWSVDIDPIRGLPKKYLTNMATLPYSLDKYIDYYKALWEQVQPYGYKAVADYQLTYRSLEPFIPTLKEHFDLKVLLIARDPIRRAAARAKYFHYYYPERNIIYNNKFTDLGVYLTDYIKLYKKLKDNIPNTHMIVMEDLWEDDGTEKDKLSNFLDHPITDLWTNLYSPDTGHKLTWDLQNTYCPVPCQVPGQSCFHLKEDYYNELRQKYKYHYDSWIDTFGSLPNNWGVSIY